MVDHFNSGLNFILGVGSFLLFSVFAFFQNVSDIAFFKDIGMGGAFIATCFFMFKYFTRQIETKDSDQKEMNRRFLIIIEEKTRSEIETREKLVELIEKVEYLHNTSNHRKMVVK